MNSSGALPENVNYAVKSSFLLGFRESVPEVSAKLKEPETKERKFEDVVKSAEQAAVLVLVYRFFNHGTHGTHEMGHGRNLWLLFVSAFRVVRGFRGSMLLRLQQLLHLFHLGTNDHLAVALIGIVAEIVLMIRLRRPEFLQRHNLCDDGLAQFLLRLRL